MAVEYGHVGRPVPGERRAGSLDLHPLQVSRSVVERRPDLEHAPQLAEPAGHHRAPAVSGPRQHAFDVEIGLAVADRRGERLPGDTMKLELLSDRRYRTREEAKSAIFEWIEVFYNRLRRHSTIGYLSPAEFERRYAAQLAV